jgi:hypothetical protein
MQKEGGEHFLSPGAALFAGFAKGAVFDLFLRCLFRDRTSR